MKALEIEDHPQLSNNKDPLERAQTPSALRAMRASRGEKSRGGVVDFAEMDVLVYDDPKQRAEVEKAREENGSSDRSKSSSRTASRSRSMSQERQVITVVNEVPAKEQALVTRHEVADQDEFRYEAEEAEEAHADEMKQAQQAREAQDYQRREMQQQHLQEMEQMQQQQQQQQQQIQLQQQQMQQMKAQQQQQQQQTARMASPRQAAPNTSVLSMGMPPSMAGMPPMTISAMATLGGGNADPSTTTQMVLDMHTREIEGFYVKKQQELLQELKDNFEQEVGKLRAKLERDIVEVNQASQRAVKAEVDNFKLHRLPAITSLLAPAQMAGYDGQGHAPAPNAPAPTTSMSQVTTAFSPELL